MSRRPRVRVVRTRLTGLGMLAAVLAGAFVAGALAALVRACHG